MQDQALNLLYSQWQTIGPLESCVWFADENSHEILPQLATTKAGRLTIISNRFDVHNTAESLGLSSFFNDVDFSVPDTQSIDHIFIRISKEKPVTHHAINEAIKRLCPNGKLTLAGYKNEGIKTYIQKASGFFSLQTKLQKLKDAHSLTLSNLKLADNHELLDDSDYTQSRQIAQFNGLSLYSKPGVFGFEKIDAGSCLLLEHAKHYIDANQLNLKSILDLGCGYGLLTLVSSSWGVNEILATDNNAAALIAVRTNVEQNQIERVVVVADDAGKSIKQKFDAILCNPPFHQGFSVSGDLTDKFLKSASQKLTKQGVAFFVVNSFIGLEKKAGRYFSKQQLLINNKQFKVFALSQ